VAVSTALKIYRKPRIRNARLVLAWGSIGDMYVEAGIEALTYLKDKLGAQPLAEIEPYDFFNPFIEVEKGLLSEPLFPQSLFYSWNNPKGDGLILFLADREPVFKRYEYARLVLKVAEQFRVSGLYFVSAFPTLISHNAEPRVLGVTNEARLVPYLEQCGVALLAEKALISMNGSMLGLARQRKLSGIYLLGEVPSYAADRPNPKSCKAILQTLTAMLGVSLDLAEFDPLIKEAEAEMDEEVKEASRAFLEDFTVDYRDFFEEENQ